MLRILNNQGSTARDFLAFERNFLSQCRFGVLLSLLSSSFLLRARIPTPNSKPDARVDSALVPFGYVYFVCGFCGICLALWYYILSNKRLRARRAFLRVTNPQTLTLGLTAFLIVATCIVLLIEDS